MVLELPPFYFRVRENGALVFRVDTANRQKRIEMEPIATVNIRNGEIKPQGGRALSATDLEAIENWVQERRDLLARRDMDDIHRAVDHLNLTSQWAQSKASEAQLEAVTDALLLAMHDLRTILVRKKADRLAGSSAAPPER